MGKSPCEQQTACQFNKGFRMDAYWYLIYLMAAIGAIGVGWFMLASRLRGEKTINDRMSDQVTRSAELVRECSSTMGHGTAFGRPSTIR